MFTIIFLLLLFGAGAVLVSGLKNRKPARIISGIVLVLFVLVFFRIIDFWGELLWFESLGYTQRFWVLELSKYGFALAGFIAGGLIVWLFLWGISGNRKWIRYLSTLLGALFAMVWGYGNWSVFLLFFNQVPTELADPIFGMPTSFYFFSLPFFKAILQLLLFLSVISLIASLLTVFVAPDMWRQFNWNQQAFSGFVDPALYNPVFRTGGIFLLLLAGVKYLDRYDLLLSGGGVVYGPGWTDVHVRLPMIWLVMGACILFGLILILPAFRNRLRDRLAGRYHWMGQNPGYFVFALLGTLALIWIVALTMVPALFQNFKVNPNEISLERPYIIHNIEFTREAFRLNGIKERQYPAADDFSRETVSGNQEIFENIRLWDYRALDAVYKQFQEFRLYYEFLDIDVDRYRFNDAYNQVMISAREMDVNNLPQQSQTFVNRKFKYTHGFGVVMNDVSEFSPSGLPELLIRDIPPKNQFAELNVEEPRIYYGEGSDEYVVANSTEEEFDFPRGEDNAYVQYEGEGGVRLNNYWRQFIFAYKFDESKLLFSGYPRPESRMMFHRNIRQRVQRLAPFLYYDQDPYIVLAEGKLYWMIDAYTVSENYPYSQPYSTIENELRRQADYSPQDRGGAAGRGVNYIRNSVKVVVDAYNGSVDFYMFDQEDPLIRTWNNVVPGLLKPWQEMPESLLEHIRYPVDFLMMQGTVYAKYHMDDPAVFYNQEDLWVRATEKYYDNVQAVEPYYIMWKLPEEEEQSFVLMMPFTPKTRQVLVGWLAGMCDPRHYGELLAYNFPKDQRVIGPQQVETKIDQDANLSSQLSLWDQRGSRVIRGNVLAIPVNETLFYVEPIYLQAETAAYPELRLVVVMHGDDMAYAPSFEEALQELLVATEGIPEPEIEVEARGEREERQEGPVEVSPALNERIRDANQAFEDYLRHTGNKDYQRASEALRRLEDNLKALDEGRE
jgi:uncharacterized membrane protein (UPF0182 family)